MDKVLSTILLVIAAVVTSVIVINTVMASVQRAGGDVAAASAAAGDRLRTDVRIVEVSATAMSDTVRAWVKNVGASSVKNPDRADTFFGQVGAFGRIAYDASASCSNPGRTASCWQYTLENDTQWAPFATLRITIYLTSSLTAGKDYVLTLVLPNGIMASKVFSL